MDAVNSINLIDGNQFVINNDSGSSAGSTDFDSVYNIETGNLSLDEIFEKVSDEYDVNVNLLKAVAQAESGFDTNAESYCGAKGIMQLMPATAQSLGVEDPFDAEQCITGGAKMLAYLLDDYNGNATLALAAYNAGSGSVQKYGGVPPYDETLRYIEKINNILDGALSNDSRTIEGATATDLSGVASEKAPNVETKSSLENELANAIQGTGDVVIGVSYPTIEDMLKAKAYESKQNTSLLFTYDDYETLLNTYQNVYNKLQDTVSSQNTTEVESNIEKNSVANTIAEILQKETSTDNSNIKDVINDTAETSQSNQNSMIGATIDEVIRNTSVNNEVKNTTDSNIQSMYEAQASVVSPLISKIYNL